jgi:hypothetical protein
MRDIVRLAGDPDPAQRSAHHAIAASDTDGLSARNSERDRPRLIRAACFFQRDLLKLSCKESIPALSAARR